ncbi:hypothetical protein [Thermoanaerobacterium sp. RBIITD]|uniref:hypothetical protein n=1 Tax=Thermoanaerobacterium sp. RBIITD TaxID=1550240 RepID=UPI000BB861C2|nr:hypothetical protein [Thermoanaerobacterium sp. RBIITD]SNX54765.1 hypothetical protein SAMN05660242_2480 [Thermoanaerobacterium sp. RBIITD]
MKRNKNIVRLIGLLVIAAMFLIVVGKYFFTKTMNPEEILRDKYSNKPSYDIKLQKANEYFSGFLGQDGENVYLDLFRDGKYFGGSVASIKQRDLVWVYQFQQYETLVVVYGYNPDSNYLSYYLEVSSTTTEPKVIKKDISKEKYILDIYVFDTKYNGTANLELIKKPGK